jgi:hypothetical protein
MSAAGADYAEGSQWVNVSAIWPPGATGTNGS